MQTASDVIYEEVNAKAYIQGLKDGKEIGRADAIDEFLRRIHSLERYKLVSENGRMDSLYYDYDIIKIAEQLKSQN